MNELLHPFAYYGNPRRQVYIDDAISLRESEEFFLDDESETRLHIRARCSDHKRPHFALPPDFVGSVDRGQPESLRHIQCQRGYLEKGYQVERPLIFTDGSRYIVDCYHPETGHIVEVVDTHDDRDKARVLFALGFDVAWHFVTRKRYDKSYLSYGVVICDY